MMNVKYVLARVLCKSNLYMHASKKFSTNLFQFVRPHQVTNNTVMMTCLFVAVAIMCEKQVNKMLKNALPNSSGFVNAVI